MWTWYFAYGSNLLRKQIIDRTGTIGHDQHPPRIAQLANYRLTFQTLEKGGPAFANVLSPGDGVVGVVYRFNEAALERLDRFEGGYERQPIMVSDLQGELLSAIAYVIRPGPETTEGRPSVEYLDRIVTGARQYGIPNHYISNVVSIAAATTSLPSTSRESSPHQ